MHRVTPLLELSGAARGEPNPAGAAARRGGFNSAIRSELRPDLPLCGSQNRRQDGGGRHNAAGLSQGAQGYLVLQSEGGYPFLRLAVPHRPQPDGGLFEKEINAAYRPAARNFAGR